MRYYYKSLPSKVLEGEVGSDYKAFFAGSADDYMAVLLKGVLSAEVLSGSSLAAFIELSLVPVCEIGGKWLHSEETVGDFLKRLWGQQPAVMSATDKALLQSANFILDRSKYSNPIIDMDNRYRDYAGLSLGEVVFHSIPSFVKFNLIDEDVLLAWQAVLFHHANDTVFVHNIVGEDLAQSECFMFHEVPITMNRVYVSKAKLWRDKQIKEKFKGKVIGDKQFMSPSIYIQGYDVSDLKGDTLRERVANLKLVKDIIKPVTVKFFIDAGVFNMSPDIFAGLHAAILAAQLQYVGMVVIGI
jgi:hypothetical protein